jgi:hypothetical protein
MVVKRVNPFTLNDDEILHLQSGRDFVGGATVARPTRNARSAMLQPYGHLLNADRSWWSWQMFGPPTGETMKRKIETLAQRIARLETVIAELQKTVQRIGGAIRLSAV